MEIDETILTINNVAGNSKMLSEHGNEIEEIISNKLPVIVRWGTLYFLLILLLLTLICWFIQYPDIITTSAKLTSINSPKELKTKTTGKLIKLTAVEGKFVQQNQLLGFMESTANPQEVMMLSAIADTLQGLLQNNRSEQISKYLSEPFQHLGEVQQSYQNFIQSFIVFNQYLSSGYFLQRKKMLQGDVSYLVKLHSNLLQQKMLNTEDVQLSQQTFNANESLIKDKVISDLDYRNEKSKLIGKKLTLPQIGSAIISNESAQHEKQKEILQLENDIAQQKGIFSQALNTLKAQLGEWKNKYVLLAPVNGTIAFASFIQENQQLQINQTICFVNPENTKYYAEVYIPQANFGKVQMGQEVLLKFSAYPFQEYGSVKGSIDFISHIPTDSGYLAKVSLPNGLKTSYDKQVQFRDGLLAQGEVITKDMRLLQRFYYSIVKQVKN